MIQLTTTQAVAPGHAGQVKNLGGIDLVARETWQLQIDMLTPVCDGHHEARNKYIEPNFWFDGTA